MGKTPLDSSLARWRFARHIPGLGDGCCYCVDFSLVWCSLGGEVVMNFGASLAVKEKLCAGKFISRKWIVSTRIFFWGHAIVIGCLACYIAVTLVRPEQAGTLIGPLLKFAAGIYALMIGFQASYCGFNVWEKRNGGSE